MRFFRGMSVQTKPWHKQLLYYKEEVKGEGRYGNNQAVFIVSATIVFGGPTAAIQTMMQLSINQ